MHISGSRGKEHLGGGNLLLPRLWLDDDFYVSIKCVEQLKEVLQGKHAQLAVHEA